MHPDGDRSRYLDRREPAVYRALVAFSQEIAVAAQRVGLDRTLVELVNIRVSQINGCAFCLDLHTQKAIRNGETNTRLAVLPAWRDTDLFTEQEAAALGLAECIAELPDAARRRLVEDRAMAVLGPEQWSVVAWIAVAMNAFNRVSITSLHLVRPARSDDASSEEPRATVLDRLDPS
jgi:AhpD family alkylhydroperoxidase